MIFLAAFLPVCRKMATCLLFIAALITCAHAHAYEISGVRLTQSLDQALHILSSRKTDSTALISFMSRSLIENSDFASHHGGVDGTGRNSPLSLYEGVRIIFYDGNKYDEQVALFVSEDYPEAGIVAIFRDRPLPREIGGDYLKEQLTAMYGPPDRTVYGFRGAGNDDFSMRWSLEEDKTRNFECIGNDDLRRNPYSWGPRHVWFAGLAHNIIDEDFYEKYKFRIARSKSASPSLVFRYDGAACGKYAAATFQYHSLLQWAMDTDILVKQRDNNAVKREERQRAAEQRFDLD